MAKTEIIDWDALERYFESLPPLPEEFGPYLANVSLLDYFRHWDECGQPMDDEWRPDHQRIEEMLLKGRVGKLAR